LERRFFLKWLGLGAVASTAYCFLPSVPIIGEETSILAGMEDGILVTPTWVTEEVARHFLNQIKFVSNANRRYDASL